MANLGAQDVVTDSFLDEDEEEEDIEEKNNKKKNFIITVLSAIGYLAVCMLVLFVVLCIRSYQRKKANMITEFNVEENKQLQRSKEESQRVIL